MFPSRHLQRLKGLPIIEVLDSHLKYQQPKREKASGKTTMDKSKRAADFYQEYTKIQMHQYKVANLKEDKRFKVPWSDCLIAKGNESPDSDLDHVAELVDRKLDSDVDTPPDPRLGRDNDSAS